MRIGVIIPDRGDRPYFFNQALLYLKRQTLQPDYVAIIDEAPKSSANDITYRYQKGYEQLKNKCDAIFCFESDDWYSERYIQEMIFQFKKNSTPNLLGINHTTYYHIKSMKWVKLSHPLRASTMSTLIKGGQKINFEHNPNYFIDIHLWQTIKGLAIDMPILNLGIKHGTGMCAGIGHRYNWTGYINSDDKGLYLKEIVGNDYKFYKPSL